MFGLFGKDEVNEISVPVVKGTPDGCLKKEDYEKCEICGVLVDKYKSLKRRYIDFVYGKDLTLYYCKSCAPKWELHKVFYGGLGFSKHKYFKEAECDEQGNVLKNQNIKSIRGETFEDVKENDIVYCGKDKFIVKKIKE